jgi:MFS family permease
MNEKGNTRDVELSSQLVDPYTGASEQQQAFYEMFDASDNEYHRQERQKLLRLVDWHLIPLLGAIYFMSFLDKNNLAQAKLAGLEKDLGLVRVDFNTATSIYFVGYILFQTPSNLLITRCPPSIYLGIAAFAWGGIAAAQAGCQSYIGLVVARFFLGLAEAPVFPGALFLLSSWYTRAELSHRFAWFYAGAQLANAFGGLVAAGVLGNLNGAQGLAAWRWLFIIEGAITMTIALLAMVFLPNYPTTTKWLSPELQAYASWRLLRDTAGVSDGVDTTTPWTGLKLALTDPRVYIFLLLQHCSNLSQTFMYFFPSIVATLNYSKINTLLISACPWIATFLVALLVSYTSGRTNDRSIHITCLMLLAFIGNIIVVSTTSIPARFVGLFLMPMGANSAFILVVTWGANSFPRPFVKRSSVVALLSTVANTASIYGTYMYPNTDAPRYVPGGSATAAVSVLVVLIALAIRLWHRKINKRLAQQEMADSYGRTDSLPVEKGFRYIQ